MCCYTLASPLAFGSHFHSVGMQLTGGESRHSRQCCVCWRCWLCYQYWHLFEPKLNCVYLNVDGVDVVVAAVAAFVAASADVVVAAAG